ncbi:MAG TPA: ABC transporter permease, partial [Patescibacteria group bacterium]|nr:ABC transporter permease [Patescibacteria group bacterium]
MFGSNIIDITTKVPGKSSVGTAVSMAQGINVTTLKEGDFEAMEQFDFVASQASLTMGQTWTTYRNEEMRIFVLGSGPAYNKIDQQAGVLKGRYFNNSENKSMQKVTVLGKDVKEELFGENDPIGKSIKIKNYNFKIIGVMEERGEMAGFNYDEIAWVPLRTAQKVIFGVDHVMEGLVKIQEGTDMDLAVARIESFLRRRHKITDPDKDDFMVMSLDQALEIANTVTQALSLLLIFLASISLIVGGVGIMNIMLVSLSERIREVGLRKAMGATDRDITTQFLTESTILTAFGGSIGIILAFIFTFLGSIAARQVGVTWELNFPLVGFSI